MRIISKKIHMDNHDDINSRNLIVLHYKEQIHQEWDPLLLLDDGNNNCHHNNNERQEMISPLLYSPPSDFLSTSSSSSSLLRSFYASEYRNKQNSQYSTIQQQQQQQHKIMLSMTMIIMLFIRVFSFRSLYRHKKNAIRSSSSSSSSSSNNIMASPLLTFSSTEKMYRSNDSSTFYGKYIHLRKKLDYNYHCNYNYQRQMIQDDIITNLLHNNVEGGGGSNAPTKKKDANAQQLTTTTIPETEKTEITKTNHHPWVIFTAGAMGVGKSYTIQHLLTSQRLTRQQQFLNIDTDEIRYQLPEIHLLEQKNAGEYTQKEAGYLSELLMQAGLADNRNCIVDGSLRDSCWYERYFHNLRTKFPHYRIAILHVTASRETIHKRAAVRFFSLYYIILSIYIYHLI